MHLVGLYTYYTLAVYSATIKQQCKAPHTLLLLSNSEPPNLVYVSSILYDPFTLVLHIPPLFVIPLVKLQSLSSRYTSRLTENVP